MEVRKNDVKRNQPRKGFIDPNKTKTYLVYHETDLLTFLRQKMAKQSQHNIRHMISNHQVAVGGAPVNEWFYKLYPEDEVTVSWTPIIYEDENVLVLNKPSGLLSVASDREKGKTAYRLVTDWLTQTNKKARVFVVHRIDEDTSGVLIFAKSFEVKEALQNHWQEIVTKRGYYAIVEGEDIPEEQTLKNYLWLDETTFQVRVTKSNIDTGRKNQIRVMLGNIGHYIIGDDRYGEPSNPLKRLGLHAYELDFTNPLNGKEYKIKAEMPACFKKLFWVSHAEKRALAEAKKAKGVKNGSKRRK